MAAIAEEDDAVREHEAMPALGELAGHEVVAGVERGQPREVGEARVGGEHEDEHRAGLEAVVEDVAEQSSTVGELADLRDDRRRSVFERRRRASCCPSIDRPRNMTPSSVPMTTRVLRAFFHSGFLKAGTPFEIASTPVTAAPPDANAFSTMYNAAPISRPSAGMPELDEVMTLLARCRSRGRDRRTRPCRHRRRSGAPC